MDLCEALKETCLAETPIRWFLSNDLQGLSVSVGEAANALVGPTYSYFHFKWFLGIINMMCLNCWAVLLDAWDVFSFIFFIFKASAVSR